MLLQIGWIMFGIEFLLAVLCGVILWFIWTHSAMSRPVARTSLFIYILGSLACLAFSLLLPI